MVIKYGKQRRFDGRTTDDQYARTRRGARGQQRKLLWIYAGAALFLLALVIYQFMQTHRFARWYPPEDGRATVTRKFIDETANGGTRHMLELNVTIPASYYDRSIELGIEPEIQPGAAEHILRAELETDRESWESVDEGATLYITYQVNMLLNNLLIREMRAESPDQQTTGAPESTPPE